MSSSKQHIKNALTYLNQTVISTVIPFLVLLVVTRYVEPEEFGYFALAQVYSVVMTGVLSLGLHVAYERNYFKYADNLRMLSALHHSLLLCMAVLFLLGGLLTYLFVDELGNFIGVIDSALLIAVLVGMSLDKLAQLYLIYFRNAEAAGKYAKYMIMAAFLNALLTLIFVVGYKMGVRGVAVGYALSWAIVVGFMIAGFRRSMPFALDGSLLWESLKLSLPLTPRSLTVLLGMQSDKYMLGMLSSIGGVGIYSLATRISTVINSYMIALQNVYTPLLFKVLFAGVQKRGQNLTASLTTITYLSLLPALLLTLFADEVVRFLLPASYSGVAQALVVLAVYYGIIFFGKITGKQLVYAEKTGLTSILAIVFAVLNVALNIPFIYYMGVLGAALATLLTGAIYTAVSFVLAQRYCRLEWDMHSIITMVILLIGGGCTALLVPFFGVSYEIGLGARLIFLLGYFYLGSRCGVISQANVSRLVASIRD